MLKLLRHYHYKEGKRREKETEREKTGGEKLHSFAFFFCEIFQFLSVLLNFAVSTVLSPCDRLALSLALLLAVLLPGWRGTWNTGKTLRLHFGSPFCRSILSVPENPRAQPESRIRCCGDVVDPAPRFSFAFPPQGTDAYTPHRRSPPARSQVSRH